MAAPSFRFLAPAAVALAALASPALAITVIGQEHGLDLDFSNAGGASLTRDRAEELAPPGGVFTNALAAAIGGSGFAASAGMTPFGVYGVDGNSFRSGEHFVDVSIAEDIVNDNGFPVDVTMRFIVNGGSVNLIGDASTELRYRLLVGSDDIFEPRLFDEGGQLTGSDTFLPSFRPIGGALGGVFDGVSRVTIPFSVQTVVFPTIAPGDTFRMRYRFLISAGGPGAVETLSYAFRDPPSTAFAGATSYSFTPAGAVPPAIPLPAAGWLLLTALAALSALAGRRRRPM